MSVGTNIQTVNFNNNVQPKMQTNFRAQSLPVKDYPPDTVEINGKKKTGMSNGAKVGIGLGILGAAALAIGLIAKGRGSQAKEVVKHIDFKKAKTIEEAKKFAKDKLGMSFDDKINNLELMNYLNEGLTNFTNKTKIKDIRFISYEKNLHSNADELGRGLVINGVFGFNVNPAFVENIEKDIAEMLNLQISGKVLNKINGKYVFNDYTKSISFSAEIENLINRYKINPKQFSFKEKMELHQGLNDIFEASERISEQYQGHLNDIIGKNFEFYKKSPFHFLNHEIGHDLHYKINPKEFEKYNILEELSRKNISKEIYDDFIKNQLNKAKKVSNYATESPAEFVAETYAELLDGRKFSDDVMTLYQKYNGPMI